MDIRKLQFTKKQKDAADELSKKLSKYFGKEFRIGGDAVRITDSGVDPKVAIREWFKAGRERMSTLHDKNVNE